MNPFKMIRSLCMTVAVLAAAFSVQTSKATPYASGLSNNAGTVSFYLNEAGGNVTITYEDGSTNANYDGVTAGINLTNGAHSFSLGSHTSYTIYVSKTGSGKAGLIASNPLGSAGGVDVNKNTNSPYFGQVYEVNRGGSIYRGNSDLSSITTSNAGVAWTTPYRLSVTADDYLLVGDFSSAGAVWRIPPDLSTNQLFLGPVGNTAGIAAGVHGEPFSRPLLIGSLANGGSATLLDIDGTFPGSVPNSLLVYSNITLAALPWETAPSLVGPEVGLNYQPPPLSNVYPGLTQGPNGYIYASNYRNANDNACVQVYDQTLTNQLWNSLSSNPASVDYFNVGAPGGSSSGTIDTAVSVDGKYIVGLGIYNQVTICSLTNGIPDVSTLYIIAPTSGTANGRGVCWDAANNFYVSSSGLGAVQSWTLGFTATAITTGNASGMTGFSLVLPSTAVSMVATNPVASQANTYGNPTNAVVTITRTGNVSSPLLVPFTLGGTAPSTSYTATATNGVTIAAGQTSTNIVITPKTDGIARPTTTVTITLSPSGSYSGGNAAVTISIINTAPDVLVASTQIPSMYNAFSNDFAAVTITRWGDTNAASFTASAFTYAGTAVAGTDYTLPAPSSVTFNPGDTTNTIMISPLSNGQPPVDSSSAPYVGNKTAMIGVGTGSGYSPATNLAIITIIDSANPPATVLYSNPLTDPNDATNWAVTSANNNMQTNAIDDTITFGYDLQNGDPSDNGAIPLPPSGATTALRITVNKSAAEGQGAAAGVNLYPTNVTFTGNYAVRFNMNIIEGYNASYTTEGALFGINHTGMATNWWTGSGISSGWGPADSQIWESDGIWYWISADGGAGSGDYIEYTGLGGTNNNTGWQQLAASTRGSYANAFKTNVFTTTGGPGLVANGSVVNGNNANNWSDVQIQQFKGVVTLSIDKTPILTYTNTTIFTNGTLMLGYNDPFSSVGTPDSSVYFSNLRVVKVGSPAITQIAVNKNNGTVVINFTTTDVELSASAFNVQSASVVSGPYANVSAATITSLGAGAFQAVVPQTGAVQFYRIVENE